MSKKAFPIVYFNLCGEMLYVVQRRLKDQLVSKETAKRVLRDIIGTMFQKSMMDEVFKPQLLYTREAMETYFSTLLNSSVMRVGEVSMSRLFDLMFMIFKFQTINCIYPEDLFLVSLNHLDSIKNHPALTPELKRKVEIVMVSFIAKYKLLIHLEWERVYEIIMDYLKDFNTKVALLMRFGLQKPNGDIIEPDQVKKRETIKAVLDKNAQVEILGESVKRKWLALLPPDWCELSGDRFLDLGKDVYSMSEFVFQTNEKISDSDKKTKDGKAIEEISLLGRLIGNSSESDFVPDILTSSDEDLEQCSEETFEGNDCCFMTIDAVQTGKDDLEQISNGYNIEDQVPKRLLELLDNAASEM